MAGGWFLERESYGEGAESPFPQIAGTVAGVAWLGIAVWLTFKYWL